MAPDGSWGRVDDAGPEAPVGHRWSGHGQWEKHRTGCGLANRYRSNAWRHRSRCRSSCTGKDVGGQRASPPYTRRSCRAAPIPQRAKPTSRRCRPAAPVRAGRDRAMRDARFQSVSGSRLERTIQVPGGEVAAQMGNLLGTGSVQKHRPAVAASRSRSGCQIAGQFVVRHLKRALGGLQARTREQPHRIALGHGLRKPVVGCIVTVAPAAQPRVARRQISAPRLR